MLTACCYKQQLSYAIRILHFSARFVESWQLRQSNSLQLAHYHGKTLFRSETQLHVKLLHFWFFSWAVDLLRWHSVICNMNATEMAYRTVHSSRVLCVREFYCQDKKIVTMETNFISSRRPEQYRQEQAARTEPLSNNVCVSAPTHNITSLLFRPAAVWTELWR